MYLSRVQINPQRRRARWLLVSPQRMHAEILNMFPNAQTGDQGDGPRILWRVDQEGQRTFLYIVSPSQPAFSKLVEEAGWATAPGVVRPYSDFLDRVTEEDRWAFRITANPVRYHKPEGAKRGIREAHVTVGYQQAWFREQATRHGFSVSDGDGDTFILSNRKTVSFDRAGSGRVTVSMAQFNGQLEVVDRERFSRALVSGIGPAKAYGCGLLTLARL